MAPLPDFSRLSHEQKDALIIALYTQVQAQAEQIAALTVRVAELEAKLNEPPKTPDNSSIPPSKGQKANRQPKEKRNGPRTDSGGRKGGGRSLALPRRRPAATAARRWAPTTMFYTGATTRSTCRRCARWSPGWNAMPGIAPAAAG